VVWADLAVGPLHRPIPLASVALEGPVLGQSALGVQWGWEWLHWPRGGAMLALLDHPAADAVAG